MALAAGCGGDGAQGTADHVLDALGREVPVRPPARRVVSLVPSTTETLVALGAADRVVARTPADGALLPATLPDVGGGLDPSLEAVLATNPDLVVAWSVGGARGTVERLHHLGVRTYAAEPRTVADIYDLVGDLGRLLDLAPRSDSLIAHVEAALRRLRERVAQRPRPTVFYALWQAPPTTTGGGTFLDELIATAGGANAFGDLDEPWPAVSMEEVVRRDPDVILVPAGAFAAGPSRGVAPEGTTDPAEGLRGAPGWSALRAVREGRVWQVDPALFGRPGPRVAEAAWTLARLLHPELGEGAGP